MILITVFLLFVVETHCKAHGVSHTEDFCVSAKGTKVGGQCLVFENGRKDWKDSVESCESKGQQLVKLTDPTAFNSFMKKNYAGQNFWLGGSDIENEGHFVWLDGSPFVCFPWDNNQPDNKVGGKQHCLAWGWRNSFSDDVCNRKIRYICEIEDPCVSAKGRKIGGKCLFFEKEHKDWIDSVKACESKGQKLVKVTDPTGFNSFMKKIYAGQNFWLGGSDIEKEGHFTWLDGSPFVNFPWENKPDNAGGTQHCLAWGHKNSFDDRHCDIKSRYICELEGYTSHTSSYAADDADDSEEYNTGAYVGDKGGNSIASAIAGDDAEDDARDTKERIIGVYAGDEGGNSKESAIADDDEAAADVGIAGGSGAIANSGTGSLSMDEALGNIEPMLHAPTYAGDDAEHSEEFNTGEHGGNSAKGVIAGDDGEAEVAADVGVEMAGASATCPTIGGVVVAGQCLDFNEEPKTWEQAKISCKAKNLQLAVLQDPLAVHVYMQTHHVGKSFWFGASDKGHEGTWEWVNGQRITGFPWPTGEPSNAGEHEDCLEWGHGNNYNDHPCNVAKSYVCSNAFILDDCSSIGGVDVAGQCLSFNTDLKTWEEAVGSCAAMNQRLASLQDPNAANAYLQNHHGGKKFWLGGSDIAREGYWIWLDGRSFDKFPWPAGEPNNAYGNEDCLGWGWNNNFDDQTCTDPLGYICEPKPDCPSLGGVDVAGQCLSFNTELKTWDQAVSSCTAKNQRLASLRDPVAVNDYLERHHGGEKFWLGGSDKAHEGTWIWLDGRSFDGFPWAAGQPNDANGIEDCLGWGWNDNYNRKTYKDQICTDTLGYICEPKPDCATFGGIDVAGQCLSFNTELKTWDQAVSSCKAKNQRLASLRDPVAVSAYLEKHHGGKRFWLGGTDKTNEGTWTWLDETSFFGFPWPAGKPNDQNSNEHCLEWGWKNDYNDQTCTDTLGYICEGDYLLE